MPLICFWINSAIRTIQCMQADIYVYVYTCAYIHTRFAKFIIIYTCPWMCNYIHVRITMHKSLEHACYIHKPINSYFESKWTRERENNWMQNQIQKQTNLSSTSALKDRLWRHKKAESVTSQGTWRDRFSLGTLRRICSSSSQGKACDGTLR